MPVAIDVYADITCPFTHVGLLLVTRRLADRQPPVTCRVKAWPLEWVNGAPLDAGAVAKKIKILRDQVDDHFFIGFDPARFPATTIPALNLAAQAYGVDDATGLAVSLDVRDALFERGLDIGDPAVLAELATAHGLTAPATEPDAALHADYAEGQRRGVRGSPDFFSADAEFFCPTLDIGHDADGQLTAALDIGGIEAFLATV